jgi:putative transposase
MSIKYKFRDQSQLYFVTFAVVFWIDLFIREEYRRIIIDSWKYCILKKGMELYGYSIMGSHIHMIVGTNSAKLEDIMRDMKRHTSVQLREAIRWNPSERGGNGSWN